MFFQLVTYEVWKNRLGGRASSPEKGQVETQVQFDTCRQNILSARMDIFLWMEAKSDMSHLLLLGKFEYGGGPIFKVVLEC